MLGPRDDASDLIEPPCNPLGRTPGRGEHNREHDEYLTPHDLGCGHAGFPTEWSNAQRERATRGISRGTNTLSYDRIIWRGNTASAHGRKEEEGVVGIGWRRVK